MKRIFLITALLLSMATSALGQEKTMTAMLPCNNVIDVFEVLRKVVLKHLGLEDIVETVLERMGDVEEIILVGDYAKGNDNGLIEVFLIGKELNMEYIAQLEEKIENLIGRKVSFYLASKFLADREHIVLFKAVEK